MTKFAEMGDTGESIDVPNICFKYFARNVKYDACIQWSSPSQSSCIDQLVNKTSHKPNSGFNLKSVENWKNR